MMSAADSSGEDAKLQIDEGAPQQKKKTKPPKKPKEEVISWSDGDIVWAKVSGFSYWPAKVFNPKHSLIPEYLREPLKPTYILVRFFGTYDMQWVSPRLIESYDKGTKKKLHTKCRSKMFMKAVKEVKGFLENGEEPEGMAAKPPALSEEEEGEEEEEEEVEEEEEEEKEKEKEEEVKNGAKSTAQSKEDKKTVKPKARPSPERKKPPPAKRSKVEPESKESPPEATEERNDSKK